MTNLLHVGLDDWTGAKKLGTNPGLFPKLKINHFLAFRKKSFLILYFWNPSFSKKVETEKQSRKEREKHVRQASRL